MVRREVEKRVRYYYEETSDRERERKNDREKGF